MNRKIFVSVITVLTGLLIYSSCTKVDSTDLGNELIPAVDNVHTFETVLDVTTDNFLYADTTRITGASFHALGIIGNDPEFGRSQAAIYTSLTPFGYGSHPFLKKDSVIIDSVVLSLAYASLFGDSNAIQRVEVSQIDPVINNFKDSIYRISTPEFTLTPGVLGFRNVDFKELNDSLTYINNRIDTIKSNNQLRIKLDTGWARKFVNYDTATQYKNDSLFRVNFRGLAIKINDGASAAKNALAYFDLTNNDKTRLTFYCRVTRNGKVDTISPFFGYTGRTQANLVSHTPANAYLTYLNNGPGNDDKIYIQSDPGSFATIKIPGLDTLKNINRVVHRAELIIEELPSLLNNIYTPPQIMFVDAINDAGDSTFTIRNDFVYTGSGQTGYDLANLGGFYNNKKYVFNLSRYVQSIVSKQQKYYTLRVYAPFATRPWWQLPDGSNIKLPSPVFVNEPIANGRVVAGGGSHPTQKMRVRIIYSKI